MTQVGEPFSTPGQTLAHAPQLRRSEAVSTSQPSARFALQLALEPAQVLVQEPWQVVPGHFNPQEPQLSASIDTSTHSPLQHLLPPPQLLQVKLVSPPASTLPARTH
jgi:hypothetical protein